MLGARCQAHLFSQKYKAPQVHTELCKDCEDGVHIEYVGQGPLLRQGAQGFGPGDKEETASQE